MAQGKLTLIYFDVKAKGEVTRLVLHAAGREFEDKRFPIGGQEWVDYKPKAPFGQLPVLEIDGKKYSQSNALNRFLADELGLGGKTNLENLHIDSVVSLCEDAFQHVRKFFFEKDEAKREEYVEEARQVGVRYAGYLENMLKENNTGYFVGDRLTLADIVAFFMYTGALGVPGEIFGTPPDSCPLLIANIEKVKANPGIAKYLASQK